MARMYTCRRKRPPKKRPWKELPKNRRRRNSAGQEAANQQRQVEAANQEQIQAEIARQVADCAAMGVEDMMNQLFGEDMGIISAAMETLAMEEDEDDEEEEPELTLALEQELYRVLEEKLAWLDTLPEPESVPYAKNDPRWSRFGKSICRGWRFVQHFKSRYRPEFLLGWDIGRAAMLARWGRYLGWITEGEAVGILWELSQKAVQELHSWREFARSYIFGGLMWKLICADGAASYLGYLADAATDLLTGSAEEDEGQWRECPWPEARRIGFRV